MYTDVNTLLTTARRYRPACSLRTDTTSVAQPRLSTVEQSRSRDVTVFVTNRMDRAQSRCNLHIVLFKLGKHIERRNVVSIVVFYALLSSNVTDRTQRRAANLPHSLGNSICCGEYLSGLLIKQDVIVAKVRPGNVPVKILGLEVQREHVGQQCVSAPERSRVASAPSVVGVFSGAILRDFACLMSIEMLLFSTWYV